MAMTREEKNAYQREWRRKNRDKIKEQNKKYREANREKTKAYHKEWRDKHREQLNEKQRERYKENPDAFKERKARYVEAHLEDVKKSRKRYNEENRQKRTDYERTKRQTDPVYRFRTSFMCLISQYLRKRGYKGGKGVWEIVGCDFETFLQYIKSQFSEGMCLENYGHSGECWNIDHIIPISTAKNDDDLERLNHYTNLRPMWAHENYIKSRRTP
jgi:hypothetical protein